MKPRLEIDNKIEEQKEELLKRLRNDIKLPVVDFKSRKFNKTTYYGMFDINIDGKTFELMYHYENNQFTWKLDTMSVPFRGIWQKVFEKRMEEIAQKIKDLPFELDESIVLTPGLTYIAYGVNKSDKSKKAFTCHYSEDQWKVTLNK
ncbi:MAG: hypothetical protein V4677_00655 [Bacteroidota bacterium]